MPSGEDDKLGKRLPWVLPLYRESFRKVADRLLEREWPEVELYR